MVIEIYDKDTNNVLVPNLKELLLLLPRESRKLVWSIAELEAITKEGSDINMLELEAQVNAASQGLVLSWDSLLKLADAFFQEINITVVGCTDEKLIPRLGIDEDYYAPCEIVIEGIDTSLWSVYAKQESDLSEMRKTYQKVEIVKA